MCLLLSLCLVQKLTSSFLRFIKGYVFLLGGVVLPGLFCKTLALVL